VAAAGNVRLFKSNIPYISLFSSCYFLLYAEFIPSHYTHAEGGKIFGIISIFWSVAVVEISSTISIKDGVNGNQLRHFHAFRSAGY